MKNLKAIAGVPGKRVKKLLQTALVLTGILGLSISNAKHDQILPAEVVIQSLKDAVYQTCIYAFKGQLFMGEDAYPYCESKDLLVIYRTKEHLEECSAVAAGIATYYSKLPVCAIISFHEGDKEMYDKMQTLADKNGTIILELLVQLGTAI